MNPAERLQLDKLIKVNDAVDNTENIRKLQHSDHIKAEVLTLLKLKADYQRLSKTNPTQFDTMCVNRCNFLFNNYTDIFNKVKKDEIDLNILFQFLHVLKQIEIGKLDQHTGSYEVGKLLKEIYIDSALKKSEHINKNNKKDNTPKKPVKNISWSEFKAKNMANSNSVESTITNDSCSEK